MKSLGTTGFRGVVAAGSMALATAASATTLASSSFDLGTDGWLAVNGSTAITWIDIGGASGGYVKASDVATGGLWFFAAPAAYTGDQHAAYGAQLSYFLRSESASAPLGTPYAQVQLLGDNGVLLTWSSRVDPSSTWTPYTVTFHTAAGWTTGSLSGPLASEAEIRSVLSNVKALRIRGDYAQAVDTTGLDSVTLVSTVPEPSTAVLMVLGVACVAAARRRWP